MQTDPVGYGDGPDWYLYAHDDPTNLLDPTGTAGCDVASFGQAECDQILEEQKKALAEVKNERDKLAKYSRDAREHTLDSGDKQTAGDLSKYFGSSTAAAADNVNSMLGNVQNVLSDDGTNYMYESVSAAEEAREGVNPATTTAFTSNGSNTISIAPLFFTQSESYRVGALIHEPTHIFGTADIAYGNSNVLRLGAQAAASWMPWNQLKAFGNADTYAHFVNH